MDNYKWSLFGLLEQAPFIHIEKFYLCDNSQTDIIRSEKRF